MIISYICIIKFIQGQNNSSMLFVCQSICFYCKLFNIIPYIYLGYAIAHNQPGVEQQLGGNEITGVFLKFKYYCNSTRHILIHVEEKN